MKKQNSLLIGCCGNSKSYAEISRMGYDYAELSARELMALSDEAFSLFLEQYQDIGFPCRGFNDFCGPDMPLVGPNLDLGKSARYMEQLCRRGRMLGVQTIGIGAPQARILPEGYPPEQADSDMASFLKAASEIAAQYGMVVLAEAVHKYLCNYMTGTKDALTMVRTLNIPNVYMVLDYYHAKVMGENLHGLSEIMPYVRHLHVSTDLKGHVRGFLKREDIPEVERLLDEALANGYRGGVSVEADPAYLTAEGGLCAKLLHDAAVRLNNKYPE